MPAKRNAGRWIALVAIAVLVLATVFTAMRFLDNQNTPKEETYYAIVPADYDIMPYYHSDGGRATDYKLTFYDAKGQPREMEFTILIDAQSQALYPPGTYLQTEISRGQVISRNAVDITAIPGPVMMQILTNYTSPATTSLTDYANWRTQVLTAMHGDWANVSCTATEDTLVYTYVIKQNNPQVATAYADCLDAVYMMQYRADYLLFPNLTAINLTVETSDGTQVFTHDYNEYIKFNYENNPPGV